MQSSGSEWQQRGVTIDCAFLKMAGSATGRNKQKSIIHGVLFLLFSRLIDLKWYTGGFEFRVWPIYFDILILGQCQFPRLSNFDWSNADWYSWPDRLSLHTKRNSSNSKILFHPPNSCFSHKMSWRKETAKIQSSGGERERERAVEGVKYNGLGFSENGGIGVAFGLHNGGHQGVQHLRLLHERAMQKCLLCVFLILAVLHRSCRRRQWPKKQTDRPRKEEDGESIDRSSSSRYSQVLRSKEESKQSFEAAKQALPAAVGGMKELGDPLQPALCKTQVFWSETTLNYRMTGWWWRDTQISRKRLVVRYRLWNFLSTWRKTCRVVNYLLCFGVGMSVFS